MSATVKTLMIDDKQVSGVEGETILDVARQNGIDIPTLCNLDGITSSGGCRLCMVEMKGTNRLTASLCHQDRRRHGSGDQ